MVEEIRYSFGAALLQTGVPQFHSWLAVSPDYLRMSSEYFLELNASHSEQALT